MSKNILEKIDIMPLKKYYLCVLCGKRVPHLTEDKRRLLMAKNLAQKIRKNKAKIKIIFCAYREIKKEGQMLMKKIFGKDFSWSIIAAKSFKIMNTKIQIKDLKNRFKKSKEKQVVIISDAWHLPRIKRYLKIYYLNDWQTYGRINTIQSFKIIKEIYKIIKYKKQGDLKI